LWNQFLFNYCYVSCALIHVSISFPFFKTFPFQFQFQLTNITLRIIHCYCYTCSARWLQARLVRHYTLRLIRWHRLPCCLRYIHGVAATSFNFNIQIVQPCWRCTASQQYYVVDLHMLANLFCVKYTSRKYMRPANNRGILFSTDFRILTPCLFTPGIPPIWRRVMTMTTTTSLHPVFRFRFGCFLVQFSASVYRSGLVVTRLPAAPEVSGSNRAADKSLCFHENHRDTQHWARAAHWLQCL